MGRYLTPPATAGSASAYAGTMPLLPGQLPTFGQGRFQLFFANETWTVPAGVTRVRARAMAGGGGHTITGGSSSFGAMLSATGGQAPSSTNGGAGGAGIGGDFQASGGRGGHGERGGGGAMGSELGNGGIGGQGNVDGSGMAGGGGAVGGKAGGPSSGPGGSPRGGSGASPFEDGKPGVSLQNLMRGGRDLTGLGSPVQNAQQFQVPWPGFAFFGGGGARRSDDPICDGGPGAGGSGGHSSGSFDHGGFGGVGGGGGGCGGGGDGGHGGLIQANHVVRELLATSSDLTYRDYRLIGGGRGGNSTYAGAGGGGYARGEFTVTPGQTINITVAQQQFSAVFSSLRLSGSQDTDRSGGLVVVEY